MLIQSPAYPELLSRLFYSTWTHHWSSIKLVPCQPSTEPPSRLFTNTWTHYRYSPKPVPRQPSAEILSHRFTNTQTQYQCCTAPASKQYETHDLDHQRLVLILLLVHNWRVSMTSVISGISSTFPTGLVPFSVSENTKCLRCNFCGLVLSEP